MKKCKHKLYKGKSIYSIMKQKDVQNALKIPKILALIFLVLSYDVIEGISLKCIVFAFWLAFTISEVYNG